MKLMKKVPGGQIIIPMVLAMCLNTFFPVSYTHLTLPTT